MIRTLAIGAAAAAAAAGALVELPDGGAPAAAVHGEAPKRALTPRAELPRSEIPRGESVHVALAHAPLEGLPGCRVPGRSDFDALYVRAAFRHSIPALPDSAAGCVLKGQAEAESNQNPRARSPADAFGIMQTIASTFREMGGVDIFDPAQNIGAGAKYLGWLFGQWRAHARTAIERLRLAWAAYNWGLGNLLRVQRAFGCVNWDCFAEHAPEETVTYVARVEELITAGTWFRKSNARCEGVSHVACGLRLRAERLGAETGDK